jgi:uncharacterized protein (DUF2236 family)
MPDVKPSPAGPLRRAIQGRVRKLVGGPSKDAASQQTLAHPDAGLFGPDSAAWKVHGDLASMLVGGVAALVLQMLDPRALGGVWDHSDFRRDRLGRLHRTARFIAGVTYGSTGEAQALIAHVRAIHDRVSGELPNGTPYSANDPETLTWVHVAGMSNFLKAYVLYRDPRLSRADQDRYYDEVRVIGEALGARDIPRGVAGVEAYLDAVRPRLRGDRRVREAARLLLEPRALEPVVQPFARMIFDAAKGQLPPWARALHAFPPALAPMAVTRAGVRSLGATLRWALPENAETRARRRAASI